MARWRLFVARDGRHLCAITYNGPSKCWWHATV